MASGAPDPVEEWAPLFTRSGLTDEQFLNPTYAISRMGTGSWCKLCDAQTPAGEKADAHMRKHKTELTAWRSRRKKENTKASKKRLAEARKEKKRQKELGIG